MNYAELKSIIGEQVFKDLGISSPKRLKSKLPKLDEHLRDLEEKERDQLLNRLLDKVFPVQGLYYNRMKESFVNGCFFHDFYNCFVSFDDGTPAGITYQDFLRNVLSVIFKKTGYSADTFQQPRTEGNYNELLTKMTEAYETTRTKSSSDSDFIANYMMTYIHDSAIAYNLMRYYTSGSAGDIYRFMDIWLRETVPTAVPKQMPPMKEDTFNTPSPNDIDDYKKIQIAEILEILDSCSDELHQLLGLQDMSTSNSSNLRTSWSIDVPLMSFDTFHTILSEAIPDYKQDIESDSIEGLNWKNNLSYYRSGKKHANRDGHISICNAYIDYLVDNHSKSLVRKIISLVSNTHNHSVAFLLDQSYTKNKDDIARFYADFLRSVFNFHHALGDVDSFEMNNHILHFGKDLYKDIYSIIRYRDQRFKTPLFNDARDDFLNYDTFYELIKMLAEYFSRPHLIWGEELHNICYWFVDTLDKKMLGRDCDVYELVPDIIMTFLWNKQVSSMNVTAQDIREFNGAGYSLALTGDLDYMNIGYRMMSSARDLYDSIKDTLDQNSSQYLKALILSNLATYFVQLSFKKPDRYEEQICLEIATAYDKEALNIRQSLYENEGHQYKGKVALANTNYATSCYYSGKFYCNKKPSRNLAEDYLIKSLKHNLRSVRLFSELEDTSDQIVRAARKVFGTILALKEYSLGLDAIELLGYKDNEEPFFALLNKCIEIIEDLDTEEIYVTKDELTVYKDIVSQRSNIFTP